VSWAFQGLEKFLNVVVAKAGGKAGRPGMHDEAFALPLAGREQAKTKKVVHSGFEGNSGARISLRKSLATSSSKESVVGTS